MLEPKMRLENQNMLPQGVMKKNTQQKVVGSKHVFAAFTVSMDREHQR